MCPKFVAPPIAANNSSKPAELRRDALNVEVNAFIIMIIVMFGQRLCLDDCVSQPETKLGRQGSGSHAAERNGKFIQYPRL